MMTFTFYIRDTRYNVPTIEFVTAVDDVRARELAVDRLLHSIHHTAVECYDGDVLLFKVSQPDRPQKI